MKHLSSDYHFVRQLVQDGQLVLTHISTTHQLADSLTKPLLAPLFTLLWSILRGRIRDK
ncbi:hypothetical protein LINPERHAP1_LOCUS16162 [Linum perenne]